jgi:hypothetical protein
MKVEIPGGLSIQIKLNIKDSMVDVECNANRFEVTELATIYTWALDFATASANLVAFAGGYGVTVILDLLVGPDGTSSEFFSVNRDLAALCTSFGVNSASTTINNEFTEIYSLVLTERSLFMALDDLIVANTRPHHAVINCARVVEAIRIMIAPPGTPPKQAWPILRGTLHLGEEYLKLITDQSTSPRHGGSDRPDGSINTVLVMRCWTIMNRFLEFRKRGNKALPMSEFPLLS